MTLLRKGKSLHVGLWNGVGGSLESGESMRDAMVRECQEESGMTIEDYRWVRTGSLMTSGIWQVDVFAAKLNPQESELNSWDEDFEIRLLDAAETDKAIMIPLKVLRGLKMAPHTGTLIHASLQALQDSASPLLTISLHSR